MLVKMDAIPRRTIIIFCFLVLGVSAQSQQEAPGTGLADARLNYFSVVTAFIGNFGPDGYWPLKDDAAKEMLHLKLESVDEKTIRLVGKNSYSGDVLLADIKNGKKIKANFTIILSAKWQVSRVELIEKGAPLLVFERKTQPPAKTPKSANGSAAGRLIRGGYDPALNSARLVDIANQSVALLDLKSRATIKETRTAEDGRFWLKNVSPGKYFIQAPGFLSLIVIKSSETLQQNIFLPATYSE